MATVAGPGLDQILHDAVERENSVPGVVARVMNKDANTDEGAAGLRALGKDRPMTLDSVFAILHDLIKYGHAKNVPSVVSSSMDSLRAVLVYEPGERWEYGCNIDWAGKVVEGACGKRLGTVFSERIVGPLDMNDSSFEPTVSMRQRRVTMH